MPIQPSPDRFAGRDEAVAAIAADGLYLVETEIRAGDLSDKPHVHPYRVDLYILDGEMTLHEPDTGLAHRLTAGCKAVVPADTLHWESSPGPFHAVFGVSRDPAIINAGRPPRA